MVVVGENVLHHVKREREGIVRMGEMSGEYARGEMSYTRSGMERRGTSPQMLVSPPFYLAVRCRYNRLLHISL